MHVRSRAFYFGFWPYIVRPKRLVLLSHSFLLCKKAETSGVSIRTPFLTNAVCKLILTERSDDFKSEINARMSPLLWLSRA
jgi:hypothetical protein